MLAGRFSGNLHDLDLVWWLIQLSNCEELTAVRTILILWVVLFAIIGCGDDEFRNSPPVVDHLITMPMPKSRAFSY